MSIVKTAIRICLWAVICVLGTNAYIGVFAAQLVAETTIDTTNRETQTDTQVADSQPAQTYYDCYAVDEIPQAECAALRALYNATDGPNWIENRDWLKTTTPCNWYGITCVNGHVIMIDLDNDDQGNNLSGSIPLAIEDLTHLNYLDLSHNRLQNVPDTIGNLSNLIGLWLNANALSSLPAAISTMHWLTSLDVGYNRITLEDTALLTFLNGFGDTNTQTQTLPPIGLSVTRNEDNLVFPRWTPITYQSGNGYYEIEVVSDDLATEMRFKTADTSDDYYLIPTLSPDINYTIRIRTFSPANNHHPYELWSAYSEPFLLNGITTPVETPDNYEPDDECTQAAEIPVDGTAQEHNLAIDTNGNTDVDWIKVPVENGVTYRVNINTIGNDADVDIAYYLECKTSPPLSLNFELTRSGTATIPSETFDTRSPGVIIDIPSEHTGFYYFRIGHFRETYGTDTRYSIQVIEEDPPVPSSTHFIYAMGDNDLYPYMGDHSSSGMLARLKELEGQAEEGVQMVVLLDGPDLGDSAYYTLSPTGLWEILPRDEVRMDDPETLTTFLQWGFERFESDYYTLSILGHANGIRGLGPDNSSSTSPSSALLQPNEIRDAIRNTADFGRLAIVHFDGCSFGLLESTSIVDGFADYVIASPNTGWGIFAYDHYRRLAGESFTPAAYTEKIAAHYANTLENLSYPYTVSVFDMAYYNETKQAIHQLGNELSTYILSKDTTVRRAEIHAIRENAQIYDTGNYVLDVQEDYYVDIGSFAKELAVLEENTINFSADYVLNTLSSFVSYFRYASGQFYNELNQGIIQIDLDKSHGIGIFYPDSKYSAGEIFGAYTEERVFPNLTSNWGWKDFLITGIPPLPPHKGPMFSLKQDMHIHASVGQVEPITVTLNYTSNEHEITASSFAFNFDESILTYNVQNRASFSLPLGITGMVDPSDHTSNQLDFVLLSTLQQEIPDGEIAQIPFEVHCPPSASGVITTQITFSDNPPLTFGSSNGASIVGDGVAGELTIHCENTDQDLWTHFVYAMGDNDLEFYMSEGDELRKGMLARLRALAGQEQRNVQIVLLLDKREIGAHLNSAYYILNETGEWKAYDQDEFATGEIDTLADFLEWGFNHFPDSRHYALSILGHANGLIGIGPDESSSGERRDLTPSKIRTALLKVQHLGHLDIVHFDGCSFGIFETSSIVEDLADYVIASPNTAWGFFAYDVYRGLAGEETTPAGYAEAIATHYHERANQDGYPNTISVFDMHYYDAVKNAIDGLGDALHTYIIADVEKRWDELQEVRAGVQIYDSGDYRIDEYDSYVDPVNLATALTTLSDEAINSAAQEVINTLAPFILYKNSTSGEFWHHDSNTTILIDLDKAQGIGIFYPYTIAHAGNAAIDYLNNDIFPNLTTGWGWREFLALSPQGIAEKSDLMRSEIKSLAPLFPPIYDVYLPVITNEVE
ncbi:MAG: clostripain-related cysteine peptidase [Chloroflexota bacterium]